MLILCALPTVPHTKIYRGAPQTLIINQFRQSSTTLTIFIEYEVVGRHLPTEVNPTPDMYRMTIFAPNETVAKSRFWYFLRGLRKVKKATGEIVSIKTVSGSKTYVATVTLTISPQIHEKHPQKVKNFGIWLRYDSRSGTHNMYKEYREMSRTDAVESLYSDMAARHRARFRSIHVLRVVELEKSDDVKRPYIKQLLTKGLGFPLPHRISKVSSKKLFSAKRPSTFA
ncbi:60S ribosomal protein L20A [Claviceps sp. LM77 group G4]|nr:60S ribosomal protein L20A [Claviceps sp. LM77 group G4]